MLTKCDFNELLAKFNNEMKSIFKEKLVETILFGSFVNGYPDDGSDIDLMVLVDMQEEEIDKYFNKITEIITDLDIEYNVFLAPIIQNYSDYENLKDVLPFFKNVQKGVKISA